ncbi:c-type cytochrome [Pelomonas sp. SE-A7]|uniref:c-type cytochrome n=1 Tax=Pelomonas sp. SE-A7 TaxID=3054953 RepID=UPI00259C85DA|nr:c-type cytochrome [Pelomonas sp. SE-A7]MDM4766597.1 c-type cytochrome [Pelomonas sp. SE-A7]
MTTCIECHGFSLHADEPWASGGPPFAPDLRLIAAYGPAEFRTLMKTGRALGDRELKMMSGVARGRFSHFSEQELADLYRFLRHQAGAPDPSKPS